MSKALAMRRAGMSKKQVAKTLGMSRSTVTHYEDGQFPEAADTSLVLAGADKVADALVSRLDAILPKMLDAAETKIETTSFKDLMIGFGIGTQRREALRGAPGAGDRTIRIIYGVDASVSSLKQLGERAVSGTVRALEPAIPGEFVVEPDTSS